MYWLVNWKVSFEYSDNYAIKLDIKSIEKCTFNLCNRNEQSMIYVIKNYSHCESYYWNKLWNNLIKLFEFP